MLCAVCLSMFHNRAKSGGHHKTRENITTAADNGCRICLLMVGNLPKFELAPLKYKFTWSNTWRPHWRIKIQSEFVIATKSGNNRKMGSWQDTIYIHVSTANGFPPGYDQFMKSVTADLQMDPCRVRRDIPAIQDIPDNSGHEKVATKVKKWLDACKEKHDCEKACGLREEGWYPKRLVYVGDEDNPPRLALRDYDNLEGTYATLSHCWGENPNFLMLKSENIEQFRHGIPFNTLAASFRDAILTCRRLSIPYIWVDSLCILQSGQDSREDWLYHSRIMHQIYLNCELNIAIEVSANPDGGAFRSRNPERLQDCYAWTPFHAPRPAKKLDDWKPDSSDDDDDEDEPDHQSCQHEQPNTELHPIYLCAIFHQRDFSYQRLSLPLANRAWVFQEKLMSPRTLHFEEDRVAWECEGRRALSEYMSNSEASDTRFGFDCLYQSEYNIQRRGKGHRFFYDYVFGYTARQLSQPDEDKLVAFAAIARRCASWIDGEYCAGIFRDDMPWGLLWKPISFRLRQGPETYRAPSWSWASIDGKVSFGPPPEGERTNLAEVIDVTVESVDPTNKFGQVKSASLTLSGPLVSSLSLISTEAVAPKPSPKEYPQDFPPSLMLTSLGKPLRVFPDLVLNADRTARNDNRLQDWHLSLGELFYLAIGELQCHPMWGKITGTHGIIVKRNDDGTYTRVGLWIAKPGFISEHSRTACEFQDETITIV